MLQSARQRGDGEAKELWEPAEKPRTLGIGNSHGDTYLMCVNAGALRQPWFPWGAAEVFMLGARSQKDPGSFCTIRFGGPGGAGGCEQGGENGTLSITRESGRGRSGDLLG